MLNDAQKKINEDPRYWTWFQKWWDTDFSWEGLATKQTLFAKSDEKTPIAIPMQTYYPAGQNNENLLKAFGKLWHVMNIPPHDLQGNPNPNILDRAANYLAIKTFISSQTFEEIHGCVWLNDTYSSQVATSAYFSRTSAILKEATSARPIKTAWNCYVDKWNGDTGEIKNSVLALEAIRSDFEKNLLGRMLSETAPSLEISECELPQVLKIRLKGDVDLIMKGNSPHQNLKIAAKTVTLSGCRASRLDLDTFISHQHDSQIYQFKYHLDFNEEQQTQININGPEKLTDHLQWKEANKNSQLVIFAHHSNTVRITNLYVGEIALNRTLHDPRAGPSLIFKNVDVFIPLNLSNITYGLLKLVNTTLHEGLDASDIVSVGPALFTGTTIHGGANFVSAVFETVFLISSYVTGAVTRESVIENANFQDAQFHWREWPTARPANVALNLSNTTFRKSLNFSHVTIDGLADFTNTVLPPNADFSDQKENPHFESLSGETEDHKNLLSKYVTNFRLLRQSLEKHGNFVEVHKLGRLEARAKIKRGATKDVSKTEIFFSRWYGRLGDFGQSLTRPMYWGIGLGALSFALQWFVLWVFNNPCFSRAPSCKFNSVQLFDAIDLGTVNLIPPFTTLAKRSAPSAVQSPLDSAATAPLSQFFSHAASEAIMLLHGAGAGILVFLFILAVKRRLQFK